MTRPLKTGDFARPLRCTGGCKTGVMMRTQTTADGIRGIFVAMPAGETPAGRFALSLDSQGRELKREVLKRGGGMVRLITPDGQGAGAAGRPPVRPGGQA